MSQPQQPPGDGNVQPPVQQQPVQPEPPQQRGPVVVHAPQQDGQLAQQFAAFRTEMVNTLSGLPEQLANSVREVTPQHPPQQQPQQPQQTAQQTQTQQHTQQPPAQQAAQQAATTQAPLRERFQRAWFGYK